MSKTRTKPAPLQNWSEAELVYFPYSPRVVADADANPQLDGSIAVHFELVQSTFGITKAELAKLARAEGIYLNHFRDKGEELSDSEIESLIIEQDKEAAIGRKPVRIRHAGDVSSALVSIDVVRNVAVPDSRSALLPGLFIVYGGADSHKSHSLAKLHQYVAEKYPDVTNEYVIAGEPDPRSVGSWAETLSVLRYGFMTEGNIYLPDVIFIDSLKDLLYMPSDGGLGSGGLSLAVTRELSSISAQLMREGRTVVAVINPSQPKFLFDWYETLKSNVTGIFFLNPPASESRDSAVGQANSQFSTQIKRAVTSSFRKWNGEYYDRLNDQKLGALIGLDVDVLDLVTQQSPAPSVVAENVEDQVTIQKQYAGGLRDRFRNFLMNSTPSNK